MCAGACTNVGFRLFVKSCNQNGRSANGSFVSFLNLLRDSCPSLLVASSSLRSNIASEDVFNAALFPETRGASGPTILAAALLKTNYFQNCLVNNLGTTRGTKWFVLQIILFPCLVNDR